MRQSVVSLAECVKFCCCIKCWRVFSVAGVLDNIELGLELLSVYSLWAWTRQQLDKLFLPMIARLSSSSSSRQQAESDDDVVARVMLGILGTICHQLIVQHYSVVFTTTTTTINPHCYCYCYCYCEEWDAFTCVG